ncbi:hypothetical protein JCM9279_004076 [Rhodotorula babjevae]
MGRRKISIAPIKDDRNRQVTFLKRKNGLFKKAYELGVLCSADVAVVVFNANGKLFEFHSGDMDSILLRYSHYAGPAHEKRGPEDYINKDLDMAIKSGTGGKMTSLSDEDGSDDDDGDDKPRVAAGSSGVRAIPQTSKGKQAIRAQAERKAKGVEPARSQSVDEGTPSDSRASSYSGPSAHYLPPPPPEHHQQQHDGGGAGSQMPQDPSQHNGFAPPGALPFPFGGLPNLGAGSNGLPNLFPFSPGAGMPSFPGFPAGLAPNFPFPMPTPFAFPPQQQQQHQQQMNGSSASSASNGVPAWFGTLNPGGGQGQMQMPQAPHLQLMQQLGMPGGMPAWPGASMADPAAAMQAFQQQQQHLQQQQQQQHEASQRHHQQAPPPHFSSPFDPPHHMQQHQQHQPQEPDASPSSHPRPAPMYGTPAVMPPPPQPQHNHSTPNLPTYPPATPGSSGGGGGGTDAPTSRPGSVASMHSHAPSHHSPAPQGAAPSPHLDAWQNKPRLSVAIPAESGAKEGTKPGLVTAGGASILGAGFGYGGRSGAGGEAAHEGDDERREGGVVDEQDDSSVPKSAFAADLLPSPFYPNQPQAASSSSSSFGFMGGYGAPASAASQHFQWPTAPPPSQAGGGPAPPLGEDEAPDLVRRGSFSDLTSAAAAAQAGEGEDGGEEEVRAGEGRGKKRENEGDDGEGDGPSLARGRKRRG